MKSNIYMFDAYGTLFDVHSAVQKAGAALGALAEPVSGLWRQKQLEYTWTLSQIGRIEPFDVLTARGLDFALAKHGIRDAILRQQLLDAYLTLDAYPDVAPALLALRAAGVKTMIFTNGTTGMISTAIKAARLEALIDTVITVDAAGIFKPAPAVYAHALKQSGAARAQDITFCSSNRWDIAGAAASSFRCVWVNRTGQPDEYQALTPDRAIRSLSEL